VAFKRVKKDNMEFVSLHNHSEFSVLSSLSTVKEIFKKVKTLDQKSVGITDTNSLASAWSGYNLYKDTGIKFIIGVELSFTDDNKNKEDILKSIVLLAKNQVGYSNLLKLNKEAFENGIFTDKKAIPVCDWSLLEKYSEGLICLTGSGNGILSKDLMSYNKENVEKTLERLISLFGDNLGLEVQTTNIKRPEIHDYNAFDQNFLNRQIYNLGKKYNVRIVATVNTHYINKEDHETHDVFLAIGSHQNKFSNYRKKFPNPDFYFKTGEEVFNFFARNYPKEDAIEFVNNSVYFANLCENPDWINPKHSNPSGKELPIFPVSDEKDYFEYKQWLSNQPSDVQVLSEDKSYLRYKCNLGLSRLFLSREMSKEEEKVYEDRLVEELDVLEFHGFSSYMLIVADYINWAKSKNIPVGPGRGSVGGCLVAYLINIHKADPIQYKLIFARFHNKEKTSFPDIDVDFATSRRHEVEEYIINKYGSNNVAHVSNLNTVTAKVYARDVARACELGGSRDEAVTIGDEIADSISDKEVRNVESAYQKCPLFVEYCKKYPEILRYKDISGKIRAWSTHAAGLVIGARSLKGLVPLRHDKDNSLALELTKDDAEAMGLVKMDLLGLSTLDILTMTNELIEKSGQKAPIIDDIPFNDEKTYQLLCDGNTLGVFQLGTSGGTTELCKKIKPKTIEDISHINALARPSAKEIRTDFIATRDGRKPLKLIDSRLNRAFGATYGFGLYEESLMYLAQDIAGWSLHEADRLRKLTKEKGKNPEKALKWRQEFIDDSTKNNVPDDISVKIWDEVVLPFGGYGFNISHSIMYSMISYYTAYYKANYPIQFLLANLIQESHSSAPDADANVLKYKNELRKLNVNILPPDVNESEDNYSINNKNQLITGFKGLKNVGDDAIKNIVENRPFTSYFDFMCRCNSRTVRANAIQAIIASGGFDRFKMNRKTMYLYTSDYRKKLQVWLKKNDPLEKQFEYPFPKEKEWTVQERFALETKFIGEAFSCPTKDGYSVLFKPQHKTIADIKKMRDKYPVDPFHFILRDFFAFKIKKEDSKYFGRTMAKCMVEDKNNETIDLTVFPDDWEKLLNAFIKKDIKVESGVAVKSYCTVNVYNETMGLILNGIYDVLPIPPIPSKEELAHKKVSLKTNKSNSSDLDSIEDELINEGLVEDDEDSFMD
jgi:DNA polymerase-3 subunit alpha